MSIKIDKVHCFFEQSGTFKNEFIKLGIPAEDYDIQNNFGQTDNVVDLFAEIEKAYDGNESIFSNIRGGDLIMAFFPCIYFSSLSQMNMYPTSVNYRTKSIKETYDLILERNKDRAYFLSLLLKLFAVVKIRGLRMIVENPWSMQTYLKANFEPPTIVDNDRMKRGDYFRKPTAFWFVNIDRTYGETIQRDKTQKIVVKCKSGIRAGLCSEERSMISNDYARNFICDFVLGKSQERYEQLSLF